MISSAIAKIRQNTRKLGKLEILTGLVSCISAIRCIAKTSHILLQVLNVRYQFF